MMQRPPALAIDFVHAEDMTVYNTEDNSNCDRLLTVLSAEHKTDHRRSTWGCTAA